MSDKEHNLECLRNMFGLILKRMEGVPDGPMQYAMVDVARRGALEIFERHTKMIEMWSAALKKSAGEPARMPEPPGDAPMPSVMKRFEKEKDDA